MSLGWAAVEAGIRDEDAVGTALEARGWQVTPFGQRVFDPKTCPELGRQEVIDSVRRTKRWPIRHAPDLLVAHSLYEPLLVEVVRNKYDDRRCMEIAKLLALDAWATIAPVAIVDIGHGTAWFHQPLWSYQAISDISRRTRVGSGDPYAWFTRDGEQPFDSVFGHRVTPRNEERMQG